MTVSHSEACQENQTGPLRPDITFKCICDIYGSMWTEVTAHSFLLVISPALKRSSVTRISRSSRLEETSDHQELVFYSKLEQVKDRF